MYIYTVAILAQAMFAQAVSVQDSVARHSALSARPERKAQPFAKRAVRMRGKQQWSNRHSNLKEHGLGSRSGNWSCQSCGCRDNWGTTQEVPCVQRLVDDTARQIEHRTTGMDEGTCHKELDQGAERLQDKATCRTDWRDAWSGRNC